MEKTIENELYSLASKSDLTKKYAAIIIDNRGKIQGIGYNYLVNFTKKSTFFYEAYKYIIHAEKNAIMSVKNKSILSKSKIIIVKIINDKNCYTGPCKMCHKLLNKYKLSKICSIDENCKIKKLKQ